MGKVKLATAWLDGCAGCHMSLLDMDEDLVAIAGAVEFTRSPITDIKDFPEVDVGLVEGAIGTVAHEEEARELRKKCKILIVLGDCACFGGIPSMRNRFSKEEVLRRAYIESESTKDGKIPSSPEIPPSGAGPPGQRRGQGGLFCPRMPAKCQGHQVCPYRASPGADTCTTQRNDAF